MRMVEGRRFRHAVVCCVVAWLRPRCTQDESRGIPPFLYRGTIFFYLDVSSRQSTRISPYSSLGVHKIPVYTVLAHMLKAGESQVVRLYRDILRPRDRYSPKNRTGGMSPPGQGSFLVARRLLVLIQDVKDGSMARWNMVPDNSVPRAWASMYQSPSTEDRVPNRPRTRWKR